MNIKVGISYIGEFEFTIENCGVAGSIFGTAITADNYSSHLIGETSGETSIDLTSCYYLTK
jgi:hypothetical protein